MSRPAPVAERFGRPVVGLDLGGGRAWSAAVAVWPSGRVEAAALAPGTPDLADQERRDRVPSGTYQRLAAAGPALDGRRSARPSGVGGEPVGTSGPGLRPVSRARATRRPAALPGARPRHPLLRGRERHPVVPHLGARRPAVRRGRLGRATRRVHRGREARPRRRRQPAPGQAGPQQRGPRRLSPMRPSWRSPRWTG